MTTAVGGCEYTDAQDPGNLELDWLEVQLDRYRDRGMQVRNTQFVDDLKRLFGNELFRSLGINAMLIIICYATIILGLDIWACSAIPGKLLPWLCELIITLSFHHGKEVVLKSVIG